MSLVATPSVSQVSRRDACTSCYQYKSSAVQKEPALLRTLPLGNSVAAFPLVVSVRKHMGMWIKQWTWMLKGWTWHLKTPTAAPVQSSALLQG